MHKDLPKPTAEMFAFYEHRTKEHIERVRRCLTLLAEVVDCGEELLERAKIHDDSKFSAEEYIPYVWLTEYHEWMHRIKARKSDHGIKRGRRVSLTFRNVIIKDTPDTQQPG